MYLIIAQDAECAAKAKGMRILFKSIVSAKIYHNKCSLSLCAPVYIYKKRLLANVHQYLNIRQAPKGSF
jgi:hypothetical protein